MIPADAGELVTTHDIAEKYKAPEKTVMYWTALPGFPEAWPSGPGRTLVRDAMLVDKWLKENLPVHWARGQDSDNPHGLPSGRPEDLVTLSDICAWEGKALGRTEPVPEVTLRSYMSKKPPKMPGPDRVPGDGKEPEVTGRRWFRKTAYEFVNRPRRMRRQKPVETAATEQTPAADRTPPVPLSLPRPGNLGIREIATMFGVSGPTARDWTRVDDFPAAGDDGYDPAKVVEWVRVNRKRSWTAAQRRAGLTGRAWPSVQATDSSAKAPEPQAEAPPTGKTASRGWQEALTVTKISERYGVPLSTIRRWTKTKEKREGRTVLRAAFPAPLDNDSAEVVFPPGDVDNWVRQNRPHVWAAYTGSGPVLVNPLPEGDPLDLLDSQDFAELLGMTTRGEPLLRSTIAAYHGRGQIPFADRTSGDGKKPEVFSDHWYRRTVERFILSRRGSGWFSEKT
ncbi:hypothetical protein [Streptomyces clavuligerus]|uniref:hypothetical protein n=1 Tax=Streptomyces clavuligerus TaxID=1901 RepID=UPI00020D953D|nr:hypothetical protein [Streptomyces clavuligerus]WDN56205.1 hypothetical protein LL058_30610 [Streptomyces clavuligerus]